MPRTAIDALSLNKSEGDSSTASRHGGAETPRTNFYKPSYKTLNHVTWSTDVSGQVNFAQAIGDTGQKIFKEQMSLETDELVSKTYDKIHKSLQEASLTWKADPEHENGQDYLAFISGEHARLAEEALTGLVEPSIAGRMRNMLMRSKLDWENGAFEEEQSMRTAYSLRTAQQTISNLNFDVANNPSTFESGLEALKNALEGYRKVAGNQAYDKVYDDAVKNFTYSYGLGLVQKDPTNFEKLVKDGRLSVIPPEKIMHLRRMADEEIRSRIADAKKKEIDLQTLKIRGSAITAYEMTQRMKQSGSYTVTGSTIDNSELTAEQKKQIKHFSSSVAKLEKKELATLYAGLSATANFEPVSGVLSKDNQLVYLEKMLPTDDKGDPTKSPQDKINMAAWLGVNATDPRLRAQVHSQIRYSENSAVLQNAIDALDLAGGYNDVLLGEPSEEVKYIANRCRGADPTVIVNIAKNARERIDAIESNPAKRQALREGAEEYFAKGEYNALVDSAWEDVRAELHAPDLFDDKDWKNEGDPWFWGATKAQKWQTEETMREFYTYFKSQMKSFISYGWQPEEARQQITSDFLRNYGQTVLVPFKVMAKPPEKVYPSISADNLKKRFHKAVRILINGYNDEKVKYKPSGFTLTYTDDGATVKYSDGHGNKKSFPNLEWNPRKNGYNLYITKEDGTRLYFTKASNPWDLVTIQLDDEKLMEEKPNVSK